jgi:hypothetical protein
MIEQTQRPVYKAQPKNLLSKDLTAEKVDHSTVMVQLARS